MLAMAMAALSSVPIAHAYNLTHAKVLCQMREYPSKLVCSLNLRKAVKFPKSCEALLEMHSTGAGVGKETLKSKSTSFNNSHKEHTVIIPSWNCCAFVLFLNQKLLLLFYKNIYTARDHCNNRA